MKIYLLKHQFLQLFLSLILVCGVLQLGFGQTSKGTTTKKPNILWIVANDISNDLGCYGNSLVHTPNLDALAKKGTVYTNHVTVGAVCSPSRSAFITGMHAVSINSHNQFPTNKPPLPNGVVPFTEFLRKEGYFLANSKGPEIKGPFYAGYNFKHDPAQMYDGFHWRERKEGQPFFAQVHLTHVHRPFSRDSLHPIDVSKVELPPYYPDHKVARQDWVMYLESIQLLDQQIGQILAQLKEDKLEENTVIFFFGDHGRAHIRDKQFLYNGGTNVPLIVSWPGRIAEGVTSDRLISNIDHAATVLHLAGAAKPAFMHGKNYLLTPTDPNTYVFAARDRCDGTLDRIRMVRSKDFKLIKNFYPERPYTQYNSYKRYSYPMWTLMKALKEEGKLTPEQSHFLADTRPEYEFYDLKNDPFEVHNLAQDPKYAKQVKQFQKVLDNWITAYDKGPHPEDAEEIRKGIATMGKEITVSEAEYLKVWEEKLSKYFQ